MSQQTCKAKPFLKWCGGKTQLLLELEARLPNKFTRYFEPFLGGGALFFHLQPEKALLSDINPELINVYTVIKYKLEELLLDLSSHTQTKDYYYQIRGVDRTEEYKFWSDIKKASRFIYLNKNCFNGLYRVNSKGQFNTPIGSQKNIKLVDIPNMICCSKVLAKTQICTASCFAIEDQITSSDFIYLDPPYAPLTPTSNFTSYNQDKFDSSKQHQLKDLCDRLDAKGIPFMVSNSKTPLILDLYSKYRVEIVYAKRAINADASKRGKIPEVIIRNY